MNIVIEERWFEAHNRHLNFYRRAIPDNIRGGVLLSHGYSEHSKRYEHVMRAMAQQGLAVFAEDHRGHGRTADVLGDLTSVDDVVEDLHILRRELQSVIGTRPLFFFGHSMGALLTLRYLQTHGGGAGAILNGPAIQIPQNIPRAAKVAARVLADYAPLFAIQGFFNPERACRDPEVWRQMRADPLRYKGKIRARTGREIMDAIAVTLPRLSEIELPVLVTHGTDDETVRAEMATVLFDAVSSTDKAIHLFDGLRHEVQHEPERDDVIEVWTDWLADHLVG